MTYGWIFCLNICSQHARTCQTGFTYISLQGKDTAALKQSSCLFQVTSGLISVMFAE